MTRTFIMALALLVVGGASADTIHLKNGVRVDGTVTPVQGQDGIYRVKAGERVLMYRESEIDRVEKNNKTGKLDTDELLRRWEERNTKLTEETG